MAQGLKKNRLSITDSNKKKELTESVHTVAHVKELHTTVDGHPEPAGLSLPQAYLNCPLVAQQGSKSSEGRLAVVEESPLFRGEVLKRRVALI